MPYNPGSWHDLSTTKVALHGGKHKSITKEISFPTKSNNTHGTAVEVK